MARRAARKAVILALLRVILTMFGMTAKTLTPINEPLLLRLKLGLLRAGVINPLGATSSPMEGNLHRAAGSRVSRIMHLLVLSGGTRVSLTRPHRSLIARTGRIGRDLPSLRPRRLRRLRRTWQRPRRKLRQSRRFRRSCQIWVWLARRCPFRYVARRRKGLRGRQCLI